MAWSVEFAADAERDLDLIFDHLLESYRGFGDDIETAFARATERVREVRLNADRLGTAPYRGTRHDELLEGLRHVTIERAIYWFDVDDDARRVRVLAIFTGGQDHIRHMLVRLLR